MGTRCTVDKAIGKEWSGCTDLHVAHPDSGPKPGAKESSYGVIWYYVSDVSVYHAPVIANDSDYTLYEYYFSVAPCAVYGARARSC